MSISPYRAASSSAPKVPALRSNGLRGAGLLKLAFSPVRKYEPLACQA